MEPIKPKQQPGELTGGNMIQLTIREVANGYIVIPGGVTASMDTYKNDDHIYVFETIEHVAQHLPLLFIKDVSQIEDPQ